MRPTFRGRSFPWLHTDEIADLLNEAAGSPVWDSQKVRRWLRRAGVAQKIGGRVVTSRDALRDGFPELWAQLLVRLTDREESFA